MSCKKSDKDKLLPSLWGGVRLSSKSGHYQEDKLSLRFPAQRKNCSQISGQISTQWVANEHGFLKPIIPGNFILMKLCRNLTFSPGRRARCCPWVSTWHLALACQEGRVGPFCTEDPRGGPARAGWSDDHDWKSWALRSGRKPHAAAWGLPGVRGAGGAHPHCRRDPKQFLSTGLNKGVTIPRAITASLKKKKKRAG